MYYSKIRVDPTNPEIAYQGGAPFFKTVDGGKTWRQVQGLAHSDHHAIWINPRDNNHLLVGNDGGLDVTYDQGATWEFINKHRRPRAVLQDQRRHAEAVLRVRRAAGQRQLVRAERGAQHQRHPELGLVPHRRRRRLLHRQRSDRLAHRLFRSRRTAPPTASISGAARRRASGRAGRRAAAATSRRAPKASIPAILAQFGFGPGAANGNIVPPPPAGDELPLLLEHAVPAVAAQPVDDLSRRRARCSSRWTAATRR